MSENHSPKMTDFDRLVSSEPIQIMKAMIPFASPSGQRILSLYSKAMELQNTLLAFRRNPDMTICSAPQSSEAGSPMDMLNSIREYCSPNTRQIMDEWVNLISMLQMAELFREQDEENDLKESNQL